MSFSTQRVADIVRKFIERDAIVKLSLARGLINKRSLAREIEKEAGGDFSYEAILSAVRRYPILESTQKRVKIGKMIEKLSVKNKVMEVSFRNNASAQKAISKFYEQLDYKMIDSFLVITTFDCLNVILDTKNFEKLRSELSDTFILGKLTNLAEIVVEMNPEVDKMIGGISIISTELALNDVNIKRFSLTSFGRMIILIDEEDVTKSYQTLVSLSML